MSESANASSMNSSSTTSVSKARNRTALRYVVSSREQQLLYRYILSRSKVARNNLQEKHDDRREKGHDGAEDDYNAATIRISLRLFLASYSGLKLWETISAKLFSKGQAA